MSHLISKPKKIEYNLEALRGAAAFFVVVHHLIYHKQYLDPKHFPDWMRHIEPPGHFCVLIFFVLSGYVIGASNPGRLTADKIVPYLKKRFIRIYPIYFISITLALLVAVPYPVSTILGNYALLQGALSNIIWENNPIWSLNYEVVYYLLFIPLSYFNVRPIVVVIVSVLIGLLNYMLYPQWGTPIITAYGYGFAFWATGWCMARYMKRPQGEANFPVLLSGLFLMLNQAILSFFYYLYDKFFVSVFHTTLRFGDEVDWTEKSVAFDDLTFLPYCLLLVAQFSGSAFRYQKLFTTVLHVVPLFMIAQYVLHYTGAQSLPDVMRPTLLYATAMLLYYSPKSWFAGISRKIISAGIKLGAISYGLYIIHFPILVLFGKLGYFSGSLLTYSIRLIAYLGVSLYAGYLLELKIQPRIAAALRKNS